MSIQTSDAEGDTMLIEAVHTDNAPLVTELLKLEANPNIARRRDHSYAALVCCRQWKSCNFKSIAGRGSQSYTAWQCCDFAYECEKCCDRTASYCT